MITLEKEELEYLWRKVEYRKRVKSTENKDELYELLNSTKTEFTKEEVSLIVKSLEFSFRKDLNEGNLKGDIGMSLSKKLI
jgi:hypothetical protein